MQSVPVETQSMQVKSFVSVGMLHSASLHTHRERLLNWNERNIQLNHNHGEEISKTVQAHSVEIQCILHVVHDERGKAVRDSVLVEAIFTESFVQTETSEETLAAGDASLVSWNATTWQRNDVTPSCFFLLTNVNYAVNHWHGSTRPLTADRSALYDH